MSKKASSKGYIGKSKKASSKGYTGKSKKASKKWKKGSVSIPSFSDMFVFGDSLSDTGNYALAEPGWPDRASNGALTVEYIADYYGLTLTTSGHLATPPYDPPGNNYAVIFSRAVPPDVPAVVTTDLLTARLPVQVEDFLSNNGGVAPEDALYVIIIGASDVFDAMGGHAVGFFTPEQSSMYLETAAASIAGAAAALSAAGEKHILVSDVYDLTKVPYVTLATPAFQAVADKYVSEMTDNMGSAIHDLKCESGVDVMHFTEVTDAMYDSALDAGLNMTSPCFMGATGIHFSDPPVAPFMGNPSFPVYSPECALVPGAIDGYGFYDEFHPTTALHEIIAGKLIDFINQESSKKSTKKMKLCKSTKSKSKRI